MRAVSIIVFFLLLGAFFIVSEKKLSLANYEDMKILKNKYSSWINNILSNSIKFTGNAIKLDWLPKINLTEEENLG